MSATPLSDLIRKFHKSQSREDYDAVLELCIRTPVGIFAFGVQPKYHEQIVMAGDDNISVGSTTHGDGQSRLLAYADPREFNLRFDEKCNAEMIGENLFKTALHNKECAGILLNCATEQISIPIPRCDIEDAVEELTAKSSRLLGVAEEAPARQRWWQLWK